MIISSAPISDSVLQLFVSSRNVRTLLRILGPMECHLCDKQLLRLLWQVPLASPSFHRFDYLLRPFHLLARPRLLQQRQLAPVLGAGWVAIRAGTEAAKPKDTPHQDQYMSAIRLPTCRHLRQGEWNLFPISIVKSPFAQEARSGVREDQKESIPSAGTRVPS